MAPPSQSLTVAQKKEKSIRWHIDFNCSGKILSILRFLHDAKTCLVLLMEIARYMIVVLTANLYVSICNISSESWSANTNFNWPLALVLLVIATRSGCI